MHWGVANLSQAEVENYYDQAEVLGKGGVTRAIKIPTCASENS
jgi:hypothetical protein